MKVKLYPFHFLSFLLLICCSESDLGKTAIKIFDANDSGQEKHMENISKILRSPDGLQFTAPSNEANRSETVGLTEKGKISFEGNMKNGKPHGEWTTFFEDGRPRWRGYKKEGISHGPFTMWYPEGRKKMIGEYINGKKSGVSTMWHLNGQKWREQRHLDGKPIGKWRTWDNKGVLIEEIDHDTTNQ